MIHIDCPLCGEGLPVELPLADELRCDGCSLVLLMADPDEVELALAA